MGPTYSDAAFAVCLFGTLSAENIIPAFRVALLSLYLGRLFGVSVPLLLQKPHFFGVIPNSAEENGGIIT
jgi:hypothetical protein